MLMATRPSAYPNSHRSHDRRCRCSITAMLGQRRALRRQPRVERRHGRRCLVQWCRWLPDVAAGGTTACQRRSQGKQGDDRPPSATVYGPRPQQPTHGCYWRPRHYQKCNGMVQTRLKVWHLRLHWQLRQGCRLRRGASIAGRIARCDQPIRWSLQHAAQP